MRSRCERVVDAGALLLVILAMVNGLVWLRGAPTPFDTIDMLFALCLAYVAERVGYL